MAPRKKRNPEDSPPKLVKYDEQMDLFTTYVGDQDKQRTNFMMIWDQIPRYTFDEAEQRKLRDSKGRLDALERNVEIKVGKDSKGDDLYLNCHVEIKPALLNLDGQYMNYYLTPRDYLVELALRDIFQRTEHGIYDPARKKSWLYFSLNMVLDLLSDWNHTFSYEELRRSILVLSNTDIVITTETDRYEERVLSKLKTVNRKKYETSTGNDSLWSCLLPDLVSDAIENGYYKQINSDLFMSLGMPVSQHIYTWLECRFTQASPELTYPIKYSVIKKNTWFLDTGTKSNQFKKLERAIKELVKKGIIQPDYEKEEEEDPRDKRRKLDVTYTVKPTVKFARNKMINNTKDKRVLKHFAKKGEVAELNAKLLEIEKIL